MSRGERAFNSILGLSVCSWAILGYLSELPRPWLVQLMISVVHLCVGFLVLTRSGVQQHGSFYACVVSIPSLIAAGLVLQWAPANWEWPVQIAFAIFGVWTVVSLLSLGRSFAVLPALRATVTRGPYSLVRHPTYLGELLMLGSCSVAAWSWGSLGLFIGVLLTVGLRIMAEERVLEASPDYIAYREQVRWRLLPGVW